MRLRDGLRVLWRDGGVQLGTDPRWAVVVDRLPERAVEAWLRDPAGEVPDPGLLTELAAAGLLAPPERPRRAGRTVPVPAGPAAADVVAWGLLRPDGDGAAVLAARAAATVGVSGLDRVGLAIATGLAAAGVGTLLLDDAAVVGPGDVGPGAFRVVDVSGLRRDAAARSLRDVAPRLRVAATGTPDLVVLVAAEAVDPARTVLLSSAGTVHLPVVHRVADVTVGPLVVPGTTPCTRCVDLHRADADPWWPDLLRQLVEPRPGPVGGGPPVAAGGLAAALAVATVLAHLDGAPVEPGGSWWTGLPDPVPRWQRWAAHPECGCAALPG